MLEQVERHNITIGKLAAKHKNVELNLYYTPTVLTTNSLVFNKKLMQQWWKEGHAYAAQKEEEAASEFRPNMIES